MARCPVHDVVITENICESCVNEHEVQLRDARDEANEAEY